MYTYIYSVKNTPIDIKLLKIVYTYMHIPTCTHTYTCKYVYVHTHTKPDESLFDSGMSVFPRRMRLL